MDGHWVLFFLSLVSRDQVRFIEIGESVSGCLPSLGRGKDNRGSLDLNLPWYDSGIRHLSLPESRFLCPSPLTVAHASKSLANNMASGKFREVLPFARHGRHSNDDICIACYEKQTNRPFADPGDWHEGSSLILARRLGHSELKQPRPNFQSGHLQSPQPVLVRCFSIITCPFSSIEPSLIYSTPLIFKLWSKKGSRVWWKWDSARKV